MPPTPSPAVSTVDITAVTSAVPWYWVPLMGLLGVITGAIVTYLLNVSLKERELRRQDRRQWDAKVLEFYLDVDSMAASFQSAHYDIAAVESGDMYKRLAVHHVPMADAGRSLELIGSEQLNAAFSELDNACSRVIAICHDRIRPDKEQMLAVSNARREFRAAARRELRIPKDAP